MGLLAQDFTTWKGNYRRIDFLISDATTVTGGTAQWGIATSAAGSPIIVKTSEAGSGITFSGKTISVVLNPEDTNLASGIVAGTYYHELRYVDASSNASTPAIGTMTLKDVILPPGE
jgi:hypothetical protein